MYHPAATLPPSLSHVTVMAHSYAQYEGTPLWRAVAGALGDLQSSGEVRLETAPDYVVGYLCQELAAKWIVASSALTRDR